MGESFFSMTFGTWNMLSREGNPKREIQKVGFPDPEKEDVDVEIVSPHVSYPQLYVI